MSAKENPESGRLRDAAVACAKSCRTRFTRFLEPPAFAEAMRAARAAGVQCALEGGYDGAERRMAAFFCEAEPEAEQWPIKRLRISWNEKFASVSHRDLLGALMGLGITRECTGDIVLGEGEAFVFAAAESAPYIMGNLISAGRAHVRVEEAGPQCALPEPKGRVKRITLASDRLDAVLAGVLNISRAQAQALVERELVKLNHIPCNRADARLNADDLISARGYGRFRLTEDFQATRKGRLAVQIFWYGE